MRGSFSYENDGSSKVADQCVQYNIGRLSVSRCTCIVLSQNWLVKNTPVSAEEEKEEVETCKDSCNFGLFDANL